MYLSGLPFVAVAAAATVVAGAAFAGPARDGSHVHRAMIPDGCRMTTYDGSRSPADLMKKFADELHLSGQQQQDLQVLTADYGERLRDLALLMRESGEKLLQTEPGDPNYWPLAQDVSATAASSAAETVILISEMREKFSAVLTTDQRGELKRKLEERKAKCKPKPPAEADPSAG